MTFINKGKQTLLAGVPEGYEGAVLAAMAGDAGPVLFVARADRRMVQAELREPSFKVAASLAEYCGSRGVAPSQFSLAWCIANPQLTSIIIGPRTMEHFDDNIGCLDVEITQADEEFIDSLVPPGSHSGFGFQDELYPVTGRADCELG